MRRGLLCAVLLAGAAAAPAHAASWSFQLLYSFCKSQSCVDGARPQAGVVLDANGNVYGTTNEGGAAGVGTVFEVTTSGKEIVRHAFSFAATDGAYPMSTPIFDASGNLYGTTVEGGAHQAGTVFELPVKGAFKILDSLQFSERPEAGLVFDANGNLNGTSSEGGAHGGGAVFQVTLQGKEKTLYSFCAKSQCADGRTPVAPLIVDAADNLLGTASAGGVAGEGLIFKISQAGKETVLCDFLAAAKCTVGATPVGGLVMDAAGNLYGTASGGGAQNAGMVFKLTPKGKETVLHSFCSVANCADGRFPVAGLVMDAAGNLYGTTEMGGSQGSGTIFEISAKKGKETVIYNFCEAAQCLDGDTPEAPLAIDASGNLYGTASGGGTHSEGTVFELVLQ